ncbi:MAG: CvpA family protein [Candidatus Levyibacteriota bacterium]
MTILSDILTLFSTQFQILNFNILDLIIIIVLIIYIFEGYSLGFVSSFFDFLSFVFSFALGLKFYAFFGSILVDKFSMTQGFGSAIGFFVTAMLAEIILSILFRRINFLFKNSSIFIFFKERKIGNCLGILPGLLSALVLVSFILAIIVSLPLSPFLKNLISTSRIGSKLVLETSGFDKKINDVFGGAVSETINFLTVEPKSDEFINLNFKVVSFKVDEEAENKMLILVNRERVSKGLGPLALDESLRQVARNHSQDMLQRGYFSHFTPEGFSPFDRLAKDNVFYNYAGENLALAPNVDLGMQGLMQSQGHRENILSPNFDRIGIGVIDGGIYGEMFTQEFTN